MIASRQRGRNDNRHPAKQDPSKEKYLLRSEAAKAHDASQAILNWLETEPDEQSPRYAEVIGELQGFLNAFATADLSESQMDKFRDGLAGLRSEAEDRWVPEAERRYGRSRRRHTGVYATSPRAHC